MRASPITFLSGCMSAKPWPASGVVNGMALAWIQSLTVGDCAHAVRGRAMARAANGARMFLSSSSSGLWYRLLFEVACPPHIMCGNLHDALARERLLLQQLFDLRPPRFGEEQHPVSIDGRASRNDRARLHLGAQELDVLVIDLIGLAGILHHDIEDHQGALRASHARRGKGTLRKGSRRHQEKEFTHECNGSAVNWKLWRDWRRISMHPMLENCCAP